MSTETGLRPAAFESQDPTAAALSESQATGRHPAIDAWGRAHERANTAEAALRRGRRVLRRWADRDLHRDAAQLLNELTAALGEDAEEQPANVTDDPLRELLDHVTRPITPEETNRPSASTRLPGWNLAMAHVRRLVGEMPAPAAQVVHPDPKPLLPPMPTVDDTDPLQAARAEGLRADRSQLLGLLCAFLPSQDTAIIQPSGADGWYLLIVYVLDEQLTFAIGEDDIAWLHDVRWALPDDPSIRVVDLLSTQDREQRVHRLIGHHVSTRRPPHPPTAAAADPETLRATLHRTGVVTIQPTTATTGTPRA